MTTDPTFHTIPEAAARLGVGSTWLRSQLAQGRFVHRKVGNRYEMSDEHIALAHAELEVAPAQREAETSNSPRGVPPRNRRAS